nr:hypothetical protein 7 [bacterium]
MTKKKKITVTHLRTGEVWHVEPDLYAKGGAAVTAWIEDQIADREETARRKQQAETFAAEAKADRLLELEALVKQQGDELTRLRHENEVFKNSPLESADAALKLNQTASQMLQIRADLLKDIEAADEWRQKHGSEITDAAEAVRWYRTEKTKAVAEMKESNRRVFEQAGLVPAPAETEEVTTDGN